MEVIQLRPRLETAEQKAEAIREINQRLRHDERLLIDERETLTAEALLPWYEEVCLLTKDNRIRTAAIDVELQLRRGEAIKAEGERRGGDHGNQHSGKVVTVATLPKAERDERSRDRALADDPDE